MFVFFSDVEICSFFVISTFYLFHVEARVLSWFGEKILGVEIPLQVRLNA